MFDKYISNTSEYVPYVKGVTVTEIKAPTDASIKLYEEIKEKAYKSILDTIVISDNVVNFKYIVYEEHCSYEKVCKWTSSINSKVISGDIRISSYYDREALIEKIVESISQTISASILESIDFGHGNLRSV